ncbi:MAG: tyrosine-type recombinase/integrase [Candidatus Melainabacteria bacterium]
MPQKVSRAGGWLSVSETASTLGVSTDTVLRWCESGRLPAHPTQYGRKLTYRIPAAALELMETVQVEARAARMERQRTGQPHGLFLEAWIAAMEKGLMTGRPFSPLTVRDYRTSVGAFVTVYVTVSPETLEAALLAIPAMQYGKRFKLYKGVVCFAKYLIRVGALDDSFRVAVKPLFPKRHLPPKRAGLTTEQLERLFAATRTPFQKMAVVLLAGTGLRACEAVALRWGDVDFERGTLTVRRGKGNKTRSLGLGPHLLDVMTAHRTASRSEWVFADETGTPVSRTSLYGRLRRLGVRAGVEVTPHALRRAFVTLNANKGRPLQMLQIACGHSDIKTTRGYCLTSEAEVIEAMKGW